MSCLGEAERPRPWIPRSAWMSEFSCSEKETVCCCSSIRANPRVTDLLLLLLLSRQSIPDSNASLGAKNLNLNWNWKGRR